MSTGQKNPRTAESKASIARVEETEHVERVVPVLAEEVVVGKRTWRRAE